MDAVDSTSGAVANKFINVNMDAEHGGFECVARDKRAMLVVEDDKSFMELTENCLGSDYVIHGARSASEAVRIALNTSLDCVLLSDKMAHTDHGCVADQLREIAHLRYTPIIMLTSRERWEAVSGAAVDDCLSRADLKTQRLRYSIERSSREKRLQEALDVERHALTQERHDLQRRHVLLTEYWDEIARQLTRSVAQGERAQIQRSAARIVNMTGRARNRGEMIWTATDLNAVVGQTLDELRVEAEVGKARLQLKADERAIVFTDELLVSRIVSLLIQQVLALTPTHREVQVLIRSATATGKTNVEVRGHSGSLPTRQTPPDWRLHELLQAANASALVSKVASDWVEYSFELVGYRTVRPAPAMPVPRF